MDLHEDIHRAIESYLDANEFRRFLNSAIQNSRGVTFLLQKRKSKWPDFDQWYGAWQDEARTNPVLAWGIAARNRIVKEEDLTTYSEATIRFFGDRTQEAEQVIQAPPASTSAQLIAAFAERFRNRPSGRKGWIGVERRWVDDQLRDNELVAVLREMYRAVASVVKTAHEKSGIELCLAPEFSRPCIGPEIDPELHCIPPGAPLPTTFLDVETGETAHYSYASFERDDDAIEEAAEKYGEPPTMSSDPIDHALERLEMSKRYLEVDGYSGPMVLFFGEDGRRQLTGTMFPDGTPREVSIRGLVESLGSWPFSGAVFASETWLGRPGDRGTLVPVPISEMLPPEDGFFNAGAAADRDEALIVVALTSDGRNRSLTLPFARTKAGIVYGNLLDEDDPDAVPNFLRPISRRWVEGGGRIRKRS
ncbi:hypothetical protein [Gryllotalpicola protaetiae]|uniref:Uncharacterized protein n=1 Tax=Gryllotalpicola protaetiae TaxID=2419771 RepID=A0A387BR42_9MICO|nr:hypothetical protein [Gryllotalpicola protaetiae]AYG03446.1 hypothetical protein D7I44_07775 [Gryllotalpicola protaetiae]